MDNINPNLLPKRFWYHRGWLVVLLILIVVWFGPSLFLKIFYQNKVADNISRVPGAVANIQTKPVDVYTQDDPSVGSSQAPVVIVEFGDFECPYCLAAETGLRQMLQKYSEAVRFEFRDFPLTSVHPQALSAAQAANCAQTQGKYWPYHNALYDHQAELSSDLYLTLAQDLSLDMNLFKTCLQSPSTLYEIQEDIKAGLAAGVVGTPTFFINGYKLEGPRDFNTWQEIIQQAIKAKFSQP